MDGKAIFCIFAFVESSDAASEDCETRRCRWKKNTAPLQRIRRRLLRCKGAKTDGLFRFGRGPRLSRFAMLDLYHLLHEIIVIPTGDMGMTCGGIVATIFVRRMNHCCS